MRFVNYCIPFLFTICTVSQLFWNRVCTYIAFVGLCTHSSVWKVSSAHRGECVTTGGLYRPTHLCVAQVFLIIILYTVTNQNFKTSTLYCRGGTEAASYMAFVLIFRDSLCKIMTKSLLLIIALDYVIMIINVELFFSVGEKACQILSTTTCVKTSGDLYFLLKKTEILDIESFVIFLNQWSPIFLSPRSLI